MYVIIQPTIIKSFHGQSLDFHQQPDEKTVLNKNWFHTALYFNRWEQCQGKKNPRTLNTWDDSATHVFWSRVVHHISACFHEHLIWKRRLYALSLPRMHLVKKCSFKMRSRTEALEFFFFGSYYSLSIQMQSWKTTLSCQQRQMRLVDSISDVV